MDTDAYDAIIFHQFYLNENVELPVKRWIVVKNVYLMFGYINYVYLFAVVNISCTLCTWWKVHKGKTWN